MQAPSSIRASTALATCLACASPLGAQEASLPATVEGAKTYTPADFARFAPKTALEMLEQVPGFSIQQADDRRGLGQASANVLINGQRFSGKTNDVVTELGRIAASNVIRIDIVDGATLDIAGLSGQVANIVTAATGMSGNFAWRPQARVKRLPVRLTNGEASLSGTAGAIQYTVSLDNDSFRNGNNGPEIVTDSSGRVIDVRDEDFWNHGEAPRLGASLKYRGSDGTLANLNGAYQLYWYDARELSLRSGPGEPGRVRLFTDKEREYNYEVGGDYETGLGAGRLKLIGLRKFEQSIYDQIATVDFADGRPQLGEYFEQHADEAETILRGEYRWRGSGADWQASAEGALNILDIANDLSTLNAAGAYVPVAIPNSTSTVTEKRAEIALSYGRPLSPTLSLQALVGAEYSNLGQSGDAGLDRTFYRPKGFVSLAWKASPRLDVSAKIEREVGQLNFYDFVASTNLNGGTSNAGNPELVPQQSWNAQVEATRNLGPYGTATLRLFGRAITDIVDVVPIGATGQAPGNLDSASVLGVQWTNTLNLDPFGWRGAKIDVDLELESSSIDDQLTGLSRRINNNQLTDIEVSFRHDVPGTAWAYGGRYESERVAYGYRLDERFRPRNSPGQSGMFVEHKDVYGLTVRGSVDNILGTRERYIRTVYDGRRTDPILFTEAKARTYGAIFTLSISGSI